MEKFIRKLRIERPSRSHSTVAADALDVKLQLSGAVVLVAANPIKKNLIKGKFIRIVSDD